jgi:hypothetical protein
VITRDSAAAYRVRGYLAMKTSKGRSTVAWLWDVYDAEQQRVQRVSGEETRKGKHADGWSAVNNEVVGKIARGSMDQLAAFLTSPAAAPAEAASAVSYASFSPEASGIFRVSAPQADPVSAEDAAENSEAAGNIAGVVPSPRRRPTAAISSAQGLTLAARQ